MGVSTSGQDEFQRKLTEENVAKAMEEAMRATVEVTKDAIVRTVETSGTNKQWSRSYRGRDRSGVGRIETGRMRNSVKTEVKRSGNFVTGRAGWLNGTPYYTKFQELGFRHYVTGEFIKGMMSIRAGRQEGTAEALRQLTKAAKKFGN